MSGSTECRSHKARVSLVRLETDEIGILLGRLERLDEGTPNHVRMVAQIQHISDTLKTHRALINTHEKACTECRARKGTHLTRALTRFQPSDMCRAGLHPMNSKNVRTYVDKRGSVKRYCAPCKAEKQRLDNEKKKFTTNPYGLRRSDKNAVPLTCAQIEAALRAIPCAYCGAVPTRWGTTGGRTVFLDHPVTDHAEGCSVPANRELETAS